MHQIKVILWDIDQTLLNFFAAEACAIRACFQRFSLGECSDAMLAEYSAINTRYWKRMERGEITKQEVLEGRFVEFFSNHNIPTGLVPAFNAKYQVRLGDTICFHDDAYAIVKALKPKVKQYGVTNGTVTAQRRKLEKSGLGALFDGVFISDEIGFEKPSKGFFDAVFRAIGDYQKDEILIVGDSLTSDMKGGCQAQIRCCWYNPGRQENALSLPIDYEITDLHEVLRIVNMG